MIKCEAERTILETYQARDWKSECLWRIPCGVMKVRKLKEGKMEG